MAAKPNGSATDTKPIPNELSALEADINKLASLLSLSNTTTAPSGGDALAAETDLAQLLEKLNTADGLAGDVEGKLDELLTKLDGMLGQMEEKEKGDDFEKNAKETG